MKNLWLVYLIYQNFGILYMLYLINQKIDKNDGNDDGI